MIRPLTFLTLIAAFGSGLYLYSEKHKAALLDREIARTIRATETARERTGQLTAEWALVNEPTRLGTMADKYLNLKPMAPTQFVALKDLATKLPAVMTAAEADPKDSTDDDAAPVAAAAPTGQPAAPDQTQPPSQTQDGAIVSGDPVAPPADPGVIPAPPPPAETKAVAAKTDPAKTAKGGVKLAHAAPKKPAHPVAMASGDEPSINKPLAHGAPLPLAAPPPMRPQVMQAMAHGTGTAHPAVMSASPHYLATSTYMPSALSGRGSLPPPVPLAPGAR